MERILVEVWSESKNLAPSINKLAIMETKKPTITAKSVCTSKVVNIFVLMTYPFLREFLSLSMFLLLNAKQSRLSTIFTLCDGRLLLLNPIWLHWYL